MSAGIVLILAGILIAVFPQLLSLIVAFVLIFAGGVLTYIGYYYKKNPRKFDDPFRNFFFRI